MAIIGSRCCGGKSEYPAIALDLAGIAKTSEGCIGAPQHGFMIKMSKECNLIEAKRNQETNQRIGVSHRIRSISGRLHPLTGAFQL